MASLANPAEDQIADSAERREPEEHEMTKVIDTGTTVRVRVPGSSANLGPGFDTLGIALGIFDEIEVAVVESGLEVVVRGEGEGDVPLNSTHLVVRAIERGLEAAGVWASGLKVLCENSIPHSRGLGSSAAAAVGGLVAANELVKASAPERALSEAQLLQLASEFEGHPDNAAASVLGGAVVSWTDKCGEDRRYSAVRLAVHPDIRAYALVPADRGATSEARGLLPVMVDHAVAAFNVSRSALAVVALTSRPDLLLEATEDLLHQPQRAAAMPRTAHWMNRLREEGIAAAVSGAGPSVLALATAPLPESLRLEAESDGFTVLPVDVAPGAGLV